MLKYNNGHPVGGRNDSVRHHGKKDAEIGTVMGVNQATGEVTVLYPQNREETIEASKLDAVDSATGDVLKKNEQPTDPEDRLKDEEKEKSASHR